LKTITTIPDYCREVNIPQPKYALYDIRKFEDKVKTENKQQSAFRHEFYAIALRHSGYNKAVNGKPLQANLLFNSPYQVISWDVLPEWKGWYLMFGQDFLALNPAWNHFIVEFPFFRLDKSIPFNLAPQDAALADGFFQKIFEEYHSSNTDKFQFIQAYTSLLLHLTKRYFNQLHIVENATDNHCTADILLVSRFQTMIEINIINAHAPEKIRKPSFYAGELHIHPNHLNAVVKRITGKAATHIIHEKFITVAKSLLKQEDLSAKEIAYKLHFKQPAHFTSFFKKMTGITPQQYQQNHIL